MTKKEKIVSISLFSGCGGLDIASHMAGVPVISSLDFEEDCIKTLKANNMLFSSKVYHADISKFSTEEYKKLLKERKPEKFIVIGGPPCQPFSKAAYWVGNKSRKIEKDPRNMVDQYLRIISELKPDGLLFENVESMLHPTNKKIANKILNNLQKEGYNVKLIHANALDYGVPQKRKRIFIIGTKKMFKSKEPKKTHCDPDLTKETGLKPYESVKKHMQDFDTLRFFEEQEITLNGTYGKELSMVQPGQNYISLVKQGKTNKFKVGKRFWSFLLKLDPDQPSWTIAAQPGPWVGPFHWTSRRLRVPEIAAIQTFPKGYKFCGTRRSIQRQIGNAVPPLLGKAMIEFLKENI